jgi:uridine kinase
MLDIGYDENEVLAIKLQQKYSNIVKSIDGIHWITREALSPKRKKPFIIAFTGASSCGKSFLARTLAEILSEKAPVSYFSQDNYYRDFKKDFSHQYSLEDFYNNINFDDPNHIRFDKMYRDLAFMKTSPIGDKFYIPKITFGTNEEYPFIEETAIEIDINPIIITEGVYALTNPEINKLYDLKVYVNMDDNVRKNIWEDRNKKEGRYYTENNWLTTIDALKKHIEPTKKDANLVLDNTTLSSEFIDIFQILFDIKSI